MKKPPDKYKCKKGIIKNVITDNEALKRIKDAVITMNKITIYTYQFLKAYYIYCLDNNLEIPVVDENFISLIFKTISIADGRGDAKHRRFATDHLQKITIIYFLILKNFMNYILLRSNDALRQKHYASPFIIQKKIKCNYWLCCKNCYYKFCK